jgi:hypothetical protein
VLQVGDQRNEGLIWLSDLLRQCRSVGGATGCRVVGCFVYLCDGGQSHGGLRHHNHRNITITRSDNLVSSPFLVAKLWLCGRLGGGGGGSLCSLEKCWGEGVNIPYTFHHSARWQTWIIAPSVLKFAAHVGHEYALCSLSLCYIKLLRSVYSCEATHKHLGVPQLL